MPKEGTFFEKLTSSLKASDAHFEEDAEENETKEVEGQPVITSPRTPRVSSTDPQDEGQLTIDVYQTDTEIVISSPIAGVKPDDVDIDITSDMVTIRGRRERPEPVTPENYFYQECYWGPFSRAVILPQEIDAAKSEAVLKNGVLTIRLPKIESNTAKKLKVKAV